MDTNNTDDIEKCLPLENVKKTEQKCTICYECINTKDYIGKQDFDCVDVDDPSCLRIKCGHAFHTNCIMQAFRGNLKCPICRESLVTSSLQNSEFYISVFDIEQEVAEDDESDDTYHPHRLRLETEIKLERCKNVQIIEKRKNLKKKIKEFHLNHVFLKKSRKKIIKDALTAFRKENHKLFHTKIKNVQVEVNNILEMEKKITEKKLSEQKITLDTQIFNSFFNKTNPLYNVYDVLQKYGEDSNLNAFQKKFWTG